MILLVCLLVDWLSQKLTPRFSFIATRVGVALFEMC